MSINLTLIGQMITFALFVFFTMKFVWPPIKKAMNDRQKTIADGLAAAQQGKLDRELAQQKAIEILREAKLTGAEIIEKSNKRASEIVEESKENARLEAARILEKAQADIEQATHNARLKLQQEVSQLALNMTEKILKEINPQTQRELLNRFVQEV